MSRCASCGSELDVADVAPHCPACLLQLGFEPGREPFRILTPLGKGPAGCVYFAEAAGAGLYASVKVIDLRVDTGHLLGRIDRTARDLSSLEAYGAPAVLETGATGGGRPFIASAFASGLPLTTGCDRLALPRDARARLLLDLCRLIAQAHACGVAHGALKPANVLVDFVGGRPAPVLLDLASAAAVVDAGGADLLRRWPAESQRYLAPDRLAGARPVAPTDDVYALGALLGELLGAEEERGRGSQGRELARIASRACAGEPTRRYPSVADLAADLAACC